jgi:dolichyl-phosphate-mannose-protein mannosyltransferase
VTTVGLPGKLATRAREAWRLVAAEWGTLGTLERATSLWLGVMLAGGVALRIQGIDSPPWLTYDEDAFVPQAHHYLVGLRDINDHPPLGKLLIAVGCLLLGYNPAGWRFASLCLGLQAMVVAYWLARCLFENRRAGWFAAAWVAADGCFLAYSRAGLLDGMLACLVLWSLLAAVTARTWRGVVAAAVLVGLATSIKWSGAMALVPVIATLLVSARTSRWSLLWLVLAPAVHLGLWLGGLWITGQPTGIVPLWELMVGLYRHHVFAGTHQSGLASPWYSWPVLYRPFVLKLSAYGLKCRYATSLGNPLLWLATTLAIVAWPIVTVTSSLRSRLRGRRPSGPWPSIQRPVWLLWLGWLALLLPWTVGRGTYTFSYHYMPSYGFGLVLLGGLAAEAERKRPRVAFGLAGAALVVAAYLAPVWSELPLSPSDVNQRLFFAPWRCPFAATTCWSGT